MIDDNKKKHLHRRSSFSERIEAIDIVMKR